MTNQQQEMIEYTTQEVIGYLMEDYKITMEQAMEQFFMSDTFGKLSDIETGLYLDGSAYIYEMLKREIQCKQNIGRTVDLGLCEEQDYLHEFVREPSAYVRSALVWAPQGMYAKLEHLERIFFDAILHDDIKVWLTNIRTRPFCGQK